MDKHKAYINCSCFSFTGNTFLPPGPTLMLTLGIHCTFYNYLTSILSSLLWLPTHVHIHSHSLARPHIHYAHALIYIWKYPCYSNNTMFPSKHFMNVNYLHVIRKAIWTPAWLSPELVNALLHLKETLPPINKTRYRPLSIIIVGYCTL